MSSENRRFLRVPTNGDSQMAKLRCDGKSLPCEIVNVSSGGFGVALPNALASTLVPGRIVIIQVQDLVVQARIAYATPDDDRTIVGLERIEQPGEDSQDKEREWSSLIQKSESAKESKGTLFRDFCIVTLLASCVFVWLLRTNAVELVQDQVNRSGTAISTPPPLPR